MELTLAYVLARADIQGTDDCRPWLAATRTRGYGVVCIYDKTNKNRQRTVLAHRAAYELTYGATPLLVLHKCNNTSCVNPKHLYAGTHEENSKDQELAGTKVQGKTCGKTKLSDATVASIQASSESSAKLAMLHGVSQVHINRVRRGYRCKF